MFLYCAKLSRTFRSLVFICHVINVQRTSPEILWSTIQIVIFALSVEIIICIHIGMPSLQTQVIWIEQCAAAEVLFADLHIHTLHRYTRHSSAHKYCMQTYLEFHWIGSLVCQCVAVDFGWNRHRTLSQNQNCSKHVGRWHRLMNSFIMHALCVRIWLRTRHNSTTFLSDKSAREKRIMVRLSGA